MAIDTSIYGQIQQPKPVNMLAQYADLMQIQGAQQVNQLNNLRMDEYGRKAERENKLMEAARGGVNALRQGGFHKEAQEIEQGEIDSETKRFSLTSKKLDIAGQAFGFVLKNPTLENANSTIDFLERNGIYSPQEAAQYRTQVAADPGKIGALAELGFRSVLSAKEQLPKIQTNNTGGATVTQAIDAVTGAPTETGRIQNTAAPEALIADKRAREEGAANRAVTMRGQNLTDARAREASQQGKVPPGYRAKPDGTLEAIPGGPADLKVNAEGVKKVSEAKDVLGLLDEVDILLPKATGSYIGAGVDQAARAFGKATEGAEVTAQLKTLQGALISKMPKMSGPQSDKDVQLYREMAGQVGDPTLPVSVRQAASKSIRALNEKYAGVAPGSSAGPTVVRTGTYGGRKVQQMSDGSVRYAD